MSGKPMPAGYGETIAQQLAMTLESGVKAFLVEKGKCKIITIHCRMTFFHELMLAHIRRATDTLRLIVDDTYPASEKKLLKHLTRVADLTTAKQVTLLSESSRLRDCFADLAERINKACRSKGKDVIVSYDPN